MQSKEAPSEEHRKRCRDLYALLRPFLIDTARSHGYALCFHGSLERDIDCVAVPWVNTASHPVRLAQAIGQTILDKNNGLGMQRSGEDTWWHNAGCPGAKPHGRLTWMFHLGGGPYLDMSVVPPRNR